MRQSRTSRSKVGVVGAACALVASALTGCGSDDDAPGNGKVMADRMSYSTLESLAEASEFAIVGEVTGSRDDVSQPAELDPDDPAYPYEPGYEPTEEELKGSALPVTRYTIEITDSLGSHRAVGDTVEFDMLRGGVPDSYTMTLDEGATYLLFVSEEFGDNLAITAVIEGVFWEDGDGFVNNMDFTTTRDEAEAFFS